MLANYFSTLVGEFKKKKIPARKSAAKKKGKNAPSSGALNVNRIRDMLETLVPFDMGIAAARPVNTAGFSPDGADLLIFRRYCTDILKIMNGYMPCELIHGTVFFVPQLNRATLAEVLNRVVIVKKLGRFTEKSEEEPTLIPAFIIAEETDYDPMDLKNDIINYYMSKSVEHDAEMDIFLVMNRCLVMKNWREKRSFIGLETNDDSLMWFFILMSEYLEGITRREIDFRKYIRHNVVYKEY